jgi:hypothetical protein
LAAVTFGDLRDQGDVYVQFVPYESLAHACFAYTLPQWLFAVQPPGIEVSGPVGVSIGLPKQNGGYAYLDDFGQYVVLLGLDPQAMTIMPVGVGRIDADAHRVNSLGEVHLQRLDYIGYALATADHQDLLARYAENKISLRQLVAQLAENASQSTSE